MFIIVAPTQVDKNVREINLSKLLLGVLFKLQRRPRVRVLLYVYVY